MIRPAVFVIAALTLPAAAGAAEVAVPAADRSVLSLTLYQDRAAQVRDQRSVSLDKGETSLVLDGVPRTIRPGSAMIEGNGLEVAERWVDGGLLSAERQLAAHLGRVVSVVWDAGAAPQPAKVLSVDGTPLFEADGKVVAGHPARILYDRLAPGLSPSPSFRANVEAASGGRRDLDLSYAADGLTWASQAHGDLDGDRLSLSVWANLANASGADFSNAVVRLVAGTTHSSSGPVRPMARAVVDTVASPVRVAVGPYHVYTLSHPVTLRDGENKQVPLLPPSRVAVERELILESQASRYFLVRSLEPEIWHPVLRVSFANTARAGLGKPLPASLVTVTRRGPGGEKIVLGEDELPALPVGAEAHLTLGEDFDVTASRVQTDFQKVSAEVSESAWEVRLANGGDRPATVKVRDVFHSDWLLLSESQPHVKDGAAQVHWMVTVPPKGETMLSYRVRMK